MDFLDTTKMNTNVKLPPSHYNLPHTEWRENQFETLQWLQNSGEGVKILEASTGSGKSAQATALAHKKQAMSLVQTKLLQTSNYGEIYNWDILFGKGNYECIHIDAEYHTKADQCQFNDVGMNKCPVSDSCPYLVQKNRVMNSPLASLNYAYYLLSRWPKQIPFDLLVMDEAHMLSDITLNYAGISIHDKTRLDWGLPVFPNIDPNQSVSIFHEQEKSHDIVKDWLNGSLKILNAKHKELKIAAMSKKKEDQAIFTRCKNMISKIEATLHSINTNSDQWFIQSENNLIYYRGKKLPGLIARPLTARHHFCNLFVKNPTSLLMSATIGDVETFASELGIDEYDFKTVPSIWPPETRPIYDLGAPRMGYKSTDVDYEKQADVIADAIKGCPNDWMGVIHVTRISEAPLLANRLARRGLGHRVWTPPEKSGTNIQMQAWEDHKKNSVGAIGIVYSWAEGVDLFEEKICINAKIPYPPLGDPFEKARQGAYGKFYLQRTAWKFMQGLGRTRRGEREHYDVDGDKNGLVAIADGNWTRIKRYLSQDILDSIVKM